MMVAGTHTSRAEITPRGVVIGYHQKVLVSAPECSQGMNVPAVVVGGALSLHVRPSAEHGRLAEVHDVIAAHFHGALGAGAVPLHAARSGNVPAHS